MIPNTTESQIQQNTIELLKKMGYKFIPKEEINSLRNGKRSEVILKDILISWLQKRNGFEYKGVKYKFSAKNIYICCCFVCGML